ncbi:DoxX family membrane protein [Bradyrhizobium sp. INPA01-394B]|uniref:DoxX family membrane protein n=1 Tax=Bradyrhizobium campsiandrae TaxID=1729892 RepID=A0ABR7U3A2_9BRAD|nr:DoxX family membrane protein [Bradyrhizobium campsiandrae]MBC9876163.1 DoxX family membrane protein [Bradyrhizobium campsiandrae]MBC9977897.1 DoxX family membrane protein [Bradyrhizobium campsiandrae]
MDLGPGAGGTADGLGDVIASSAKQVETATAMTTPQLLVIALGGLEILAGLMIALNFGARFFAMLMAIYVAVSTVLFSDFWNQAAPENAAVVVDALKNLSIIGALFMIMGYGRETRPAEAAYGDV